MRYVALCSALLTSTMVSAVPLSPYTDDTGKLHASWQNFAFKKADTSTHYAVETDPSKGAVIHAIAEGSATALKHRLDQPLGEASVLRWSWKIGVMPTGSDAKHKETDDYAARIYITFLYDPARASTLQRAQYGLIKAARGEYPPHAALNYIVEPNLPVGTVIDNPFTHHVKMIVVDNGKSLGTWQSFERNVLADYEKAFGEAPTKLSGIVLMSDADNTHTRAEAWYGPIMLTPK
jgi:hypothetical protein